MGGANTGGGGGNSNQVSGYEAEITKQRRQQSNAINTDQKVGTYGDTKTGKTFGGEYSKENQNPNNNIQTKKKKTTVVNNGGDGGQTAGAESGNNTITQVTQTAPTEAEVSQATTAEADADTEANRLLKIKKKGRSQSIISGSQGVTKTSTDYSLGKKSLLGRV
jgi:hypothetical protein